MSWVLFAIENAGRYLLVKVLGIVFTELLGIVSLVTWYIMDEPISLEMKLL